MSAVHAQACPGLAEAIEQHGPDSAEVEALLDRFVTPLGHLGIDVVALGCTHYPWVAEGYRPAHAGRCHRCSIPANPSPASSNACWRRAACSVAGMAG